MLGFARLKELGLACDSNLCAEVYESVDCNCSDYRTQGLRGGFVLLESNTRHRELHSQHLLVPAAVFTHTDLQEGPMSTTSRSTAKNRLLAALPEREYQRLLPHLEPFLFDHARVLYEIDETINYCYFPHDAVVSLVTQMEDGKIVEVALVGNDGVTGLVFLLGQKKSAERAIVQIPNGGMRIKADVLLKEFMRGEGLHAVLLRYLNSLLRQVAQTAACNASHTIEERLSRWLLMCHDRVESDQINLTQEFIAEMLGTRRATVNVGAINLQSAGLIKYNRGRIQIIDRPSLEESACECYEAVRRVTD